GAAHGNFADNFMASVHVRHGDDRPDPKTFAEHMKIAKSGDHFVVSDMAFKIELPWEPKLELVKASSESIVKLTASHGDSQYALMVDEMPSAMALARTSRWLDDFVQREADALTKSLADAHPKVAQSKGTSGT